VAKNKIIIDQELGCAKIVIESRTYGYFESLIDIEDIERVSGHRWMVNKEKNRDVFYVKTSRKLENGKYTQFSLHRFILLQNDLNNPLQVDHRDGDTLDNRMSNLRLVTQQQNSFNKTKAKGYTWHSSNNKWQAQLMVDGKNIHLGYFDSEQAAREAYLSAKAIYHQID
jgi:hypothetical protein